MMTRPPLTPLALLARLSADGRVYRAMGHYLAAGIGRVLAVPAHLAAHDDTPVVRGCPVPIEELLAMLAALDAPRPWVVTEDPDRSFLALFCEEEWSQDWIAIGPGDDKRLLRLAHPLGIRYAEAA
jgi:hypothetical protein